MLGESSCYVPKTMMCQCKTSFGFSSSNPVGLCKYPCQSLASGDCQNNTGQLWLQRLGTPDMADCECSRLHDAGQGVGGGDRACPT